jgi:hypothetical protein
MPRKRGGKTGQRQAKRQRVTVQADEADEAEETDERSSPAVSVVSVRVAADAAAAAAPITDVDSDVEVDADSDDEYPTSMETLEKQACRKWKDAPASSSHVVMINCHDMHSAYDRSARTLRMLLQVTRNPFVLPYIERAHLTSRDTVEKQLQLIFGGTIRIVSYLHLVTQQYADSNGLLSTRHWVLLKPEYEWLPLTKVLAAGDTSYTYNITVEYYHDTVYNPPQARTSQQRSHVIEIPQSSTPHKITHAKNVRECIARYEEGEREIKKFKKENNRVIISPAEAKQCRGGWSTATYSKYARMFAVAKQHDKLRDKTFLDMTPNEFQEAHPVQ